MKGLKLLSAILMLFCGLQVMAQQAADSLTQRNAGQADTAQNATAHQQTTTDTTGKVDAGAPAPSAANTVISQTSSQSGSPAVLSGNSGSDRDGTNNVQRATMNMVGSPAGNLELDDKKTVDPDTEMKDRQDYAQDKQSSAKNQNAGSAAQPSTGGSDEINEKSRRENNAQSDQNLSAKDKKSSDADSERTKASREKADRESKKGKSKG